MLTNLGVMGIDSNEEVGTSRAALTDRSFAHVAHQVDDSFAQKGFDPETMSLEEKESFLKLRSMFCLTCYVLMFIKWQPLLKPDYSYAHLLARVCTNHLQEKFNQPLPTNRRRDKLEMLFDVFAIQSAVFEKFGMAESALDYDDMLPDENGHLKPFAIDMVCDVIVAMQRCLDQEVIITAFSHTLDYTHYTSSHAVHTRTAIACTHGEVLDRHTIKGNVCTDDPPSPAGPVGVDVLADAEFAALEAAMRPVESAMALPARSLLEHS